MADNACITEDDGEKETGTVKIVIDTERYEYAKGLEFGKFEENAAVTNEELSDDGI